MKSAFAIPEMDCPMNRTTTLHEVIDVERNIEDVYRYLLDFSTIEQWDPGVYRSRKIDAGAPQVGTRFDITLNLPSGRQPMQYRLIEAQPNKLLVLHGEGQGFSAVDTITFETTRAQHTRISYTAELSFEGARNLVQPALGPLLRRIGRKAVDGMHTALSVEAPIHTSSPGARLSERLLLPAARNFTERGYLRMPNKGLSERMDGKTVIVTGPTSGLGLATAYELARLGARVALVGRDEQRLQEAQKTIQDFSGCEAGNLPVYRADLSLLSEVRRVANDIRKAEKRIDVLVNNAGALFNQRRETTEGFECALAINLLAPWLLIHELLPTLKESRAHVINVASGGMYLQPVRLDDMDYLQGRYDGSKAYARAKRALVDATAHLAAIHPEVRFNAMHPGWAATPGVSKSLPGFEKVVGKRLRDSRMGADTIVWLASSNAASQASGLFWFDREARPTSVVAGTTTSAEKGQALIEWLDRAAE